jgi:choline dehydrogenase
LLREIQRWLIHRRGLLANGAAPITAFLRSRPEIDVPDLQFFASPGTINLQKAASEGNISMERKPGISLSGYVMRPNSRGTIAIRSPDPSAQPEIRPSYLSDESDRRLSVDIYRWARRIAAQPALSSYFSHESHPGPTVSDDEALLASAIRSGTTSHHQCGTCAMGSVVDERLRLTGVSALRVVDASVMPRLVSGNTNAATIMIAEKAADMIIQDSKAAARIDESAC